MVAHSCRYSQRTLIPTQSARGCAGDTAISCVQSIGLARNEPFALNEAGLQTLELAHHMEHSSAPVSAVRHVYFTRTRNYTTTRRHST
jgi:hypothetical protein